MKMGFDCTDYPELCFLPETFYASYSISYFSDLLQNLYARLNAQKNNKRHKKHIIAYFALKTCPGEQA